MDKQNQSTKQGIINKLQRGDATKKSMGAHLQQRQAEKIISTAIKDKKIDFKDQGFDRLNAEKTIAECTRRL